MYPPHEAWVHVPGRIGQHQSVEFGADLVDAFAVPWQRCAKCVTYGSREGLPDWAIADPGDVVDDAVQCGVCTRAECVPVSRIEIGPTKSGRRQPAGIRVRIHHSTPV